MKVPRGSIFLHLRFAGDTGELPENPVLNAVFYVADLLRHSWLVNGPGFAIEVSVGDQEVRAKFPSLPVSLNSVSDTVILVEPRVR